MCIFSKPKTPKLPEQPKAPEAPPKLADEAVRQARTDEVRRSKARAGTKSTNLTGAKGITDQAAIATKALLG